jgi:hypothetical protein
VSHAGFDQRLFGRILVTGSQMMPPVGVTPLTELPGTNVAHLSRGFNFPKTGSALLVPAGCRG